YYELQQAVLLIAREIPMPVVHKDVRLEYGYRIDLLVNNKVVVEIKTEEGFYDAHVAQVLTYLKAGN
ncbi:MAG TPA: GxxExxY protein, partial [Chitinophagaceae bacterium]|nr:GxxExxY protein [Chitinophagaceae bacterium]